MSRKFIVGVDSGTTKAVALLDIDTSFYEIYSEKNTSFSDICGFICKHGSPLIVCSDRCESKLAHKLAAAFNAKLLNPKNNLTNREKKKIVSNFFGLNNHEKDALAAALHCRSRCQKLFTKIENRLARRRMLYMSMNVKEIMLKRKAQNISEAIEITKQNYGFVS